MFYCHFWVQKMISTRNYTYVKKEVNCLCALLEDFGILATMLIDHVVKSCDHMLDNNYNN